jgi:hypothetical protein
VLHESIRDEWILLSILLTVWLLRLVAQTDRLLLFPDGFVGLGMVLAVMIILRRTDRRPTVLWDDSKGVLLLVRTWRVEACAARLMMSVPLGIDLSRSAWRVLQSMHAAMSDGRKGTLRFFVCRPLGQGPTRVGIMVMRASIRLGNSSRKSRKLSDRVVQDARILEGAIKVAYPHMPVEKAALADIMMVVQGGVQSIA